MTATEATTLPSGFVICIRCNEQKPHHYDGMCIECYVPGTPCASPGCRHYAASEGLDVCWRHTKSQLGITYRQLDYWTRRGWLRPGRQRGHGGSGSVRVWPAAELEIARRMGRLTAVGVSAERAAGFARDGWPRAEIAPGIVIEMT